MSSCENLQRSIVIDMRWIIRFFVVQSNINLTFLLYVWI